MTTSTRRLPQQIKKKKKKTRPNPNESWAVWQNTIIKNEYLSKRKKEKIQGNKVEDNAVALFNGSTIAVHVKISRHLIEVCFRNPSFNRFLL